ncbi:MAG: proline--tRNA ligase [Spirochaetaceae bacterium]|nr:proline--tRNA ligase [Spirochaetaceae bacterium]
MRIGQMFYHTLKEVPKEAQIPSHQLMFRAGMIQQLSSGVYNYLPLALKSIRKIENIIRDELSKRECQEVLLPVVQPAELWKESGRWDFYGAELLRFKDRKENDFCLGPTHEEVVTDMVRKVLKSYRQLPWNIFQIQTKFRDEVRPRFGLMRGREFIMKDGYSFDIDEESSKETYNKMYEAYQAIFKRTGVQFRAVEAVTGNIGGSMSHEFQVLAKSGEDLIMSCVNCDYAANVEIASSVYEKATVEKKFYLDVTDIHTPGQKTIDEVSAFLEKDSHSFIKSLVYIIDEEPVLVLIRGDKDLNEAKLMTYFGANSVELADDIVIEQISGTVAGFVGPVGLKKNIKIVADYSVYGQANMITGANRNEYHIVNVNPERDFEASVVDDFGFVASGDRCPRCRGVLEDYRGIEVGQVFSLGIKYSKSMNCTFLDKDGKEQLAVMGCYGIGVGRTMAAAIEQNHDENGIIWPISIAPYEVVVLPLQMNSEEVVAAGESIYAELKELGADVALDDREERAGFKFKDADLIGYPLQVIIGRKSLDKGVVEVKIRKSGEKFEVLIQNVFQFVQKYISDEKE